MKSMKAKKLLLSALAVGLILPAAAGSVIAAEKSETTPVTYDNRNYIPDPEHPDTPKWAVTIPSAINFTDENKEIDATVELVSKNGGSLPSADITVEVSSANAYKLINGSESIDYKLNYNGTTMINGTNETVAVLNGTGLIKQSGVAVLGEVTVSTRGKYSDILTYTVTK